MSRYQSFERLSFLTQRLPIVLTLCWMALHLLRPFKLGFYFDDWLVFVEPLHGTAPFSLARLHFFFGPTSVFGPRPLLGLFAFFVSSVFGDSAFGFQCVSSLLVLVAALSLRSWFNSLLDIFPGNRNLVGDLAAIFWMVMPWMLGVTAWPILAQTLIAQVLFTEAARLLVKHKELTPKFAAQLMILLMACGLVYEAFYFQVFLLVAFYAIYRRGPTQTASQIAYVAALCALAQAIPIAYNTYRIPGTLGYPTLGFRDNLPGASFDRDSKEVGTAVFWAPLWASCLGLLHLSCCNLNLLDSRIPLCSVRN